MRTAGRGLDPQSSCAGQGAQTPRTGSPPFKRSSCSEARQAPPERQALLGKLFTSLELLHAAKAAAAAPIRRSPPLLGQGSSGAGHVVHQQPVGTALSKHDAQLGRPDSPQGMLCCEGSVGSVASGISLPSSWLHSICHTPPSGSYAATTVAPVALHPLQDSAGQPQQLLLLHAHAAASRAAEAAPATQLQLASVLEVPPTMQPAGFIVPSPQLQLQAPLSAPAGCPYVAPPLPHVARFLLEHCWQQEVGECLVGMEGQYQQYCSQVISHEINTVSRHLLSKLKLLQRAEQACGIAKRYVCSMKEAAKVMHRSKCLIVAPDVKPNPNASIDPVKTLAEVLRCAQLHSVPVVFTLSRRGIGQVLGPNKTISIVAVTHTGHCETECATLVSLALQGCQLYRLMHATKPFST